MLVRLQAFGLVASAQLVDKMLQMGGCFRRVSTENLLKTLAYGIADRSAGSLIKLFDVICIWTFHDQFRARRVLGQVTGHQVAELEFVSGKLWIPIGFG
jgi:hypothetical protein